MASSRNRRAQYLRDARITTFYERTTGIQRWTWSPQIAREGVKLRSMVAE